MVDRTQLVYKYRYALQSFSNKWTNATTLCVWSCLGQPPTTYLTLFSSACQLE